MELLSPKHCSINTATLGFKEPITRVIEQVASHGFGAISPWRRELEGQNVRAVAKQIRDAGLKVSGYCRSGPIPALTSEEREALHSDNCTALVMAAELGAECFVIVAGGLPKGSKDIADAHAQVTEGIDRLLREAEKLDVPLAIEPLHPMYAADRCCVNTLGQALDICAAIDPSRSKNIGVAIDAYHVWWDPNLSAQIGRAGIERRILGFHICDWLNPTTDILMDRGMMGEGVIALQELRRSIVSAGYSGFAEIEIFSNRWARVGNDEVLQACVRSL